MAIWTWSVRIVRTCIGLVALPLFYRRESIAADDVLLPADGRGSGVSSKEVRADWLKPLAVSIALYVGVAVFYVPWSQADDTQGWVSLQSLRATTIAGVDDGRAQVPNGFSPGISSGEGANHPVDYAHLARAAHERGNGPLYQHPSR